MTKIKKGIKIYEDSLVDLNHIKYSLKLKSHAEVIVYLIDQERRRNDL